MRVVQLVTQARGGPVDHAASVAIELARTGHESHLLGPRGEYAAALTGSGVVWHETRVERMTDLAGARRTARAVRALAPDVLHCQDRRAGLLGRLVGPVTGLPTVYTLHGVPDSLSHLVPGNLRVAPATARDRLGYLHAERWLGRAPRSAVVVPCVTLGRYAVDHVGLRPATVHVVPNGVDVDRHPVLQHHDRNGATAAWLGLMQPVKRVPRLVRVLAEVPDLRLRLIGDGPLRPAVEAMVAACDVADRVDVVGFRADPEVALDGADLLVLPSAAEACPMAVLQAMARGLPVVASAVGGVPEIVRDGVEGLLVPAADDDALRDALHRLAKDPGLRRELGAAARRRVRARFTVEHTVRRLVDVYEQVSR